MVGRKVSKFLTLILSFFYPWNKEKQKKGKRNFILMFLWVLRNRSLEGFLCTHGFTQENKEEKKNESEK